jgi:hypothetical protein
MPAPFSIAHVSPYPWEDEENEVNVHVARVAAQLSARGHRVLVLAPSRSAERVRHSRRELRAARGRPQSLLAGTDGGAPRVIAVGEVLDVPSGQRRRVSALPIDVARTIEEVLTSVPLDFVHVHEPFAPSTSNAALRHSRALNVASFHSSSERLLSTLVARRFVATFFGRLDARTASLPAPVADAALRARLASRPLIDVDLHMHTDHSHDCATPVEVLLASAREQGLGAIAVTDHNEISGALEARAQSGQAGVKVIVGEEIKTDGQGEVIGLFIEEKIPRGLPLAETVAEIKRQGGLVYVPHPFDRMHSVPDYQHLMRVLDEVDAIEVYNPRVAIAAFNEEADRFAAKYRVVAAAGSDSHVPQGLGSVRIRMRDFEGPAEFLQSLADAEILTRPSSLLYVQALKFLQTRATPPSAQRASRARRLKRVRRSSSGGTRN